MKKLKYKITFETYLKAQRRASRQEELDAYGKSISFRHVIHTSKKRYNRQQNKYIEMDF